MDELIAINKQILGELLKLSSLMEEQLAPRREQERKAKEQKLRAQLQWEAAQAKTKRENEIGAMQQKESTELQERYNRRELSLQEFQKEQEKLRIRVRLEMLEIM